MTANNQVAEASAKYLAGAVGQTVPSGYKQTEVGVIPEDWDVRIIKNLGFDISDGNYSSKYPRADEFKLVGIPFIRANNIKKLTISDEDMRFISPEKHAEITKGHLKQGDLLITNRGEIGNIAVVPDCHIGSNINAQIVRINTTGTVVDTKYFSCYLQREEVSSRLLDLQTGSALKQLPVNRLITLPVVIPSPKEQTAIANTLSDVDALINGLEKLIAKKQAIKAATMQQLLTGRTRLPQFALREDGALKGYKQSELGEIPEDWEAVALRLMLKESPKYGINAASVPLSGNLPVYIRITDISDDGYFKPTEKVGVNSPLSELYKLRRGDILLARTGASVGKSYLYREADGELIYAGFLIKVTTDQSKLNSAFLSQYLKTENYWSWVTVNSMRSGQPGINSYEYGNLLVPTPTIDEQTAIATILSDMDADIQTLQQRLVKTRQIKQGMMQELLTGRVRLVSGE